MNFLSLRYESIADLFICTSLISKREGGLNIEEVSHNSAYKKKRSKFQLFPWNYSIITK
jgi:hypothetical protein